MAPTISVFVTYSHQDEKYLKKGSLYSHLEGLERDGFELWHDRRIGLGQLWNAQIRQRIERSHLVLALVSQAFLDSPYCQDVEIREFLARDVPVLPVILSACEWRRHKWLSARQFFPRDGRNVERHYVAPGKRKELFHEVRAAVRTEGEAIRARLPPTAKLAPANPFFHTLAIRDPACFVGREKLLWDLRARLNGGSVALIGEPKIGKSSLLWQVAATWSDGEVLGPLDFQQLESPDDVYAELAAALKAGDRSWPELRRMLRQKRALLLLGELDAAPEIGFDTPHLARLRSVCNENQHLHLLASCRNPPKDLFPARKGSREGSQAYNLLQPVTVGTMLEAEVRCLLGHPWAPDAPAFDPPAIEELVALAAGHPFKAQRAAFHRFQALHDPGQGWQDAWRRDVDLML